MSDALADLSTDFRDIINSLSRKHTSAAEMILVTPWAGVIRSQETTRAVAIMKFTKIGGARQNIVVRIVRISSETVLLAQRCLRVAPVRWPGRRCGPGFANRCRT